MLSYVVIFSVFGSLTETENLSHFLKDCHVNASLLLARANKCTPSLFSDQCCPMVLVVIFPFSGA